MPMKVRRLSMRALMIAVALAALASYGSVLGQRSARFAAEADKHYRRMALCLDNRDSHLYDHHMNPKVRRLHFTELEKGNLEYFGSWAAYEEQLIWKYRWAAMFPLFSPGDDPPPPTPFHAGVY